MAQVNKPGICDRRCRACAYSFIDNHVGIKNAVYCGYLVRTNKRRPCPAGKGCTEYKPRGDAKK